MLRARKVEGGVSQALFSILSFQTMSIRLSSSFQKSPAGLTDTEHPILAVKITPDAAVASSRRAFHLALLLDTSGSMDGPRITAVKTTMNLLLDAITDGDVLTLIGYESVARVLAQATTVDASSRATLRTAVDTLRADGGTNLEAAFVSLREVTSTAGVPTVDAVFILTDGHINQGEARGANALTRLLTAAIPGGTPVYTLGFGADHNSRMLRDMALRSRGSYTYADAAELIPATIADIISGLATEVGRNSRLVLPTGWTCLEITAEAAATEFNVGVLVAEKEQWVVLKGPAGPMSFMPVLEFIWHSHEGASHTETLMTFTDFESGQVEEQYCRCRVATVQTAVQDLLETGQIAEARAALTELGAELDASPAKDRTFVISLRAQVDEMVDALSAAAVMPLHPPALRGGGLARARAGVWGGMPSGAPSLAPILSRMASNTAALGTQSGALAYISSERPGARAGPSGITHTFSSPGQRAANTSMTARYSQMAGGGTVATPDPDDAAYDAAIAEALAAATTAPRIATPPAAPRISTPVYPEGTAAFDTPPASPRANAGAGADADAGADAGAGADAVN